jgi:hypothetical protein
LEDSLNLRRKFIIEMKFETTIELKTFISVKTEENIDGFICLQHFALSAGISISEEGFVLNTIVNGIASMYGIVPPIVSNAVKPLPHRLTDAKTACVCVGSAVFQKPLKSDRLTL